MNDSPRIVAPWLFLAAGVLAALALGAVVWAGWGYYRLPEAARPAHPRHAELRSSGTTGLACGLGGTLLMCLNLTYLVRKRLLRIRWLGTLRSWMAFHVMTGIVGPLLILVHTSFRPRSALGILGLSAMGIAVVTGILGRFIYAHVPRSPEGRELDGEELRYRLRDLRSRLGSYGLDTSLLAAGENAAPRVRSLAASLKGVFLGDPRIRRAYRELKDQVRRHKELALAARHILPLARGYYRDRQFLARYAEARALMGAWRFLHRWLAIVMLAVVAFHVLLAVSFGGLRLGGLLG